MQLFHRTTSLLSAFLRRSFSPPRQISLPGKMNSTDCLNRSSLPPTSPCTDSGNSVIPFTPVSAGVKDGNAYTIIRIFQTLMVGNIPILGFDSSGNVFRPPFLGSPITSGPAYKEYSSLNADVPFDEMKLQSDFVSTQNMEDSCGNESLKKPSEGELDNVSPMPDLKSQNVSPMPDLKSQMEELSLPTEFGMKRKHFRAKKPQSVPRQMKYVPVAQKLGSSNRFHRYEPFDICLSGSGTSCAQASLQKNTNAVEDMLEFADPEQMDEITDSIILRPGMILLKNYVTLSEQVEIVKKCRELGLGPGGFYQPGFQHGGKLHLQMMCLGLNWDPETRKYEDSRTIDGTRPPVIPHEFSLLVDRAIQDAQARITDKTRVKCVEKVLPSMTPDICITNFYTTSGRLGLHQDRDESKNSLQEGLPVVSISIGDSADFLYGDRRDIEKADNVFLESGDVLIFGGRSRYIFHGVTSIIPDSAPNKLLEETRLRPGRLNLTFRQY